MKLLVLHLLLVVMIFANIKLPENFQADFTQTVTNTKKKVISYNGKISFSNKTLFKWQYISPTQKEVCTNGLELLVVDHDLEQVSIYRVDKGMDIAKILSQAILHSKNIYVADYNHRRYTIQIDESGKLQSLAYFDDLDNKVQILFINIKYGTGELPQKSMQCNYPLAYDMIRG